MIAVAWLPPEQYIVTLPKATVYGCFYVTDDKDRPLQLRSTQKPDHWQWPGGIMDPGETPWQCAVREALEETGLHLGTEPRLLAMHFLPPMDSWPLHKIGFIFDGGRLTPAQIDAIVLDPEEHTELSVRSLDAWRTAMTPARFHRLNTVHQARLTGITRYIEETG